MKVRFTSILENLNEQSRRHLTRMPEYIMHWKIKVVIISPPTSHIQRTKTCSRQEYTGKLDSKFYLVSLLTKEKFQEQTSGAHIVPVNQRCLCRVIAIVSMNQSFSTKFQAIMCKVAIFKVHTGFGHIDLHVVFRADKSRPFPRGSQSFISCLWLLV